MRQPRNIVNSNIRFIQSICSSSTGSFVILNSLLDLGRTKLINRSHTIADKTKIRATLYKTLQQKRNRKALIHFPVSFPPNRVLVDYTIFRLAIFTFYFCFQVIQSVKNDFSTFKRDDAFVFQVA